MSIHTINLSSYNKIEQLKSNKTSLITLKNSDKYNISDIVRFKSSTECVYCNIIDKNYDLFKVAVMSGDEHSKTNKIIKKIESINENHKYVIWGKSDCPFCVSAKQLLPDAYWKDITAKPVYHQLLKDMFKQTTVPYIFINNKFIGGRDDLISKIKDKTIILS